MSVFTNPAASSAEQARAYTTAVLDLLGARNPVEVLEHTASALRQVVGGLSPQQVSKPEAPGGGLCGTSCSTWLIQNLCGAIDSAWCWPTIVLS